MDRTQLAIIKHHKQIHVHHVLLRLRVDVDHFNHTSTEIRMGFGDLAVLRVKQGPRIGLISQVPANDVTGDQLPVHSHADADRGHVRHVFGARQQAPGSQAVEFFEIDHVNSMSLSMNSRRAVATSGIGAGGLS